MGKCVGFEMVIILTYEAQVAELVITKISLLTREKSINVIFIMISPSPGEYKSHFNFVEWF